MQILGGMVWDVHTPNPALFKGQLFLSKHCSAQGPR